MSFAPSESSRRAANAHVARAAAGARSASAPRLRALLMAGCVASAALAAGVGDPSAALRADPELAFLLRGMAAIKASLVLAAIAVLWWRFGRPVSRRSSAAYLAGACLASGATVLIWQLSFVPLAAVLFHVGELVWLVSAWREHRASVAGTTMMAAPR